MSKKKSQNCFFMYEWITLNCKICAYSPNNCQNVKCDFLVQLQYSSKYHEKLKNKQNSRNRLPAVAAKALPNPIISNDISVTVATATPNTVIFSRKFTFRN